jgi:hypothetical protein
MAPDVSNTDPAEGSREVIEHELERMEARKAWARKRGDSTAKLTRDDVAAAVPDADDQFIALVLATGAEKHDLMEAMAWVTDNDAAIEAGLAPPSGRAGRIVDLLRKLDEARLEEP